MDILIDVLRNMEDNNITSIKELSEIMEAKIDADKQYKADEIRTEITETIKPYCKNYAEKYCTLFALDDIKEIIYSALTDTY
jgi:hypothetical protein